MNNYNILLILFKNLQEPPNFVFSLIVCIYVEI